MKTSLILLAIFFVFCAWLPVPEGIQFKQDPPVCPSDRIFVKTLTDSSVNKINFSPIRADVQELIKIKAPTKITPHMERTGKEFNAYQVNCYVKSYTLTQSGDYRLTIQGFDDSTATAIAQIINPGCEQARKSKYASEFQSAYETFSQYALLNHKAAKGVYKVAGTILFDAVTGKDGTPSNVATIHPVTLISKFK